MENTLNYIQNGGYLIPDLQMKDLDNLPDKIRLKLKLQYAIIKPTKTNKVLKLKRLLL
ncbi:hypothetical protein [Anaerotignum propionicum]|uniref:Uncharacterized protein n=1 Tax=Anaerotignum propionicum DSM 1682 TaxID=991789 RepID=A0A0X1U8S3_ANAPI|nr:hypothetical protein [Anaerotignum propionicum]AMJ41328.1 hypothetical protein CPRO_17400 [Anaerotignum propionicum DSM 1682]SHE97162.1 hypothetical protein SAMN02745151_02366 [[Clostridium] propionicum DSM 1682] [Anaerotignum propionicum DSM 1682]